MTFVPSEDLECMAFVRWLDQTGIRYSHLPLETPCTDIQSARLKKMGVRKGVPDYLLVVKNKLVFIEMKRSVGGTLRPTQRAWLEALQCAGAHTFVCEGSKDAIACVTNFVARE